MTDGTQDTHGFSVADWEATKEECKYVLRRVARNTSDITYSALVAQLKPIRFEPHDHRFFDFLGQVSTEEDESGRGLMTALVVHKTGDKRPGTGFYELAESRGRDVSDIIVTWINEVNKVHAVWAR